MPTEAMVLNTFEGVKMADLKPYQEKETIKNLVKPFKSEGKIVKTETDAKLGTTMWTLNNGAKVTFKKTDFKDDEIVFSARSMGGSSLINDADYNKTQFAFPALSEAGVNGYSKADLTNYLAGKQVSVNPAVTAIFEGISGKTNQKDLSTAMELMYAYFTGLNYNPDSFNAYKTKQSAMLDNLLSNPQFYFSSEHAKFMNQKNPRFIGIVPMEKDWANTDYKKAYDIYKEKFANAGNFQFYFVGNIDEAKFKNEVLQYIASLPSTGKSGSFKDTGYRQMSGDFTKTYKKGKDPKSMVTISYIGEAPYNEKEALALEALGEVATIKVIEKLREDESGIYGGGARGGMYKVPFNNYSFSINFPCRSENAEKLTKSALTELQKLIDKDSEQKDLDKYKEGEYNDHKTSLRDNMYWMNALTKNQMDGSDKYEILNYEEKVKALTVKDLQDVGKNTLQKAEL
ncbi:M16 family metallopeptidase [Chryseobacterium wanjuense]